MKMSALRAVFKTHLPLAGIRRRTNSIAALRADGSLKYSPQSTCLALSCLFCRSVSTVQSTEKEVKSKLNDEEEENDEPVKFSTSKAANWRAEHTFKGTDEEIPAIQPMVVSLSISVFLIYFLCLREENDIDQKLVNDLDEFL